MINDLCTINELEVFRISDEGLGFFLTAKLQGGFQNRNRFTPGDSNLNEGMHIRC